MTNPQSKIQNPKSPNALLVVAKRPAAGRTKTRLTPPLSPAQAAALYECFLRDTLDLVRQVPDVQRVVAYLPTEARDYFVALAPDFGHICQQGGDLGDRLDNALTHYLRLGYRRVAIMNSDGPTLPASCLVQAFEALSDGVDVVLGPCDDGGYYLIGLQRPAPRLLREVRMSTPAVVADTLALAAEEGLRVKLLPTWYDVDDAASLDRLAAELAAAPPTIAPRTRAFLSQMDESPIPNPQSPIPITVIVPALNEAGNIRRLVAEVLATAPVHVIVVDNGSTDATAAEARAAGAQVVHEPRRGYGYACAAGVAAAPDAEVLAFLDGDYSFLPAELPVVLAPILGGEADLVLGSRWRGHIASGAMPLQQRFGNWLAARLMNRLYGLSITDLGPYRAIRRSLLAELGMREMTFGWPAEMLVKAAKRGARIAEAPVCYQRRRAGRSKVSGTLRGTILAAWFILGVTLRYAWRR